MTGFLVGALPGGQEGVNAERRRCIVQEYLEASVKIEKARVRPKSFSVDPLTVCVVHYRFRRQHLPYRRLLFPPRGRQAQPVRPHRPVQPAKKDHALLPQEPARNLRFLRVEAIQQRHRCPARRHKTQPSSRKSSGVSRSHSARSSWLAAPELRSEGGLVDRRSLCAKAAPRAAETPSSPRSIPAPCSPSRASPRCAA